MRTALLLTLLLVTSLHADEFEYSRTVERANLYIDTHRVALGIDADNELRLTAQHNPAEPGYASFEQWYRGVKVRYSWLFLNFNDGDTPAVNDRRVPSIDLDVTAVVRKEDAKRIAETKFPQITARDPELLIVPRRALSAGSEPVPSADRLTWVVTMNGPGGLIVHVDAQSGEVYFVERTQLCGGPPMPRPQS